MEQLESASELLALVGRGASVHIANTRSSHQRMAVSTGQRTTCDSKGIAGWPQVVTWAW